MELIDQSKSVLENLSYLSGVIVSIIGIFAIWQLILAVKSFELAKETLEQAKNEFKTSSKRASAYESAQLCEKFIKNIVSKVNDFENRHKELQYPKIIGGISNFDNTSKINIENKEEAMKTINEVYNKNIEFFLTVLNDMETFSMYFTKKIADEDIAYQTLGKTYIDYVENFHHFIVIMNIAQENTAYRNIRKLYKKWRFK